MKLTVAKGGQINYEGKTYKEGDSFEFDPKSNESLLDSWKMSGVIELPKETKKAEEKSND